MCYFGTILRPTIVVNHSANFPVVSQREQEKREEELNIKIAAERELRLQQSEEAISKAEAEAQARARREVFVLREQTREAMEEADAEAARLRSRLRAAFLAEPKLKEAAASTHEALGAAREEVESVKAALAKAVAASTETSAESDRTVVAQKKELLRARTRAEAAEEAYKIAVREREQAEAAAEEALYHTKDIREPSILRFESEQEQIRRFPTSTDINESSQSDEFMDITADMFLSGLRQFPALRTSNSDTEYFEQGDGISDLKTMPTMRESPALGGMRGAEFSFGDDPFDLGGDVSPQSDGMPEMKEPTAVGGLRGAQFSFGSKRRGTKSTATSAHTLETRRNLVAEPGGIAASNFVDTDQTSALHFSFEENTFESQVAEPNDMTRPSPGNVTHDICDEMRPEGLELDSASSISSDDSSAATGSPWRGH